MSANSHPKKRRLVILGAGDLGQLIAHHCQWHEDIEVVGFLDDIAPTGSRHGSYPVLGNIEALAHCTQKHALSHFLIGIGYKHFKFREQSYLQAKEILPAHRLIHPSCHIDPSCHIEEGCILLPGSTLDKGVRLSENVLINTACTIAHDSSIGAHSFLAPRVAIAGYSTLGQRTFCGINSTIIDNLQLSDDIQLAAGAVVTTNLSQTGWYQGIPAKLRT